MSNSSTSNISQNDVFSKLTEANKERDKLYVELCNTRQEMESVKAERDCLKAELSSTKELLYSAQEQMKNLMEMLKESQAASAESIEANRALAEQLRILADRKFGQKSEKRKSSARKKKDSDDSNDSNNTGNASSSGVSVSPDPENISDQESSSDHTAPRAEKKKKQKKPAVKKSLLEYLNLMGIAPEVCLHEMEDQDQICAVCGGQLQEMGTKHIRFEFIFVPSSIRVIDHQAKVYICPECKKQDLTTDTPSENLNLKPAAAPVPSPVLTGTWASSSLLAMLITYKCQYQLPVNRLTKMIEDVGVYCPSAATLCEWIIRVSQRYFEPLFSRMKEILISRDHLAADETTLLVINESVSHRKKKSFLWQYRTVEGDEFPVVLYEYCYGRSGQYAARFLNGFQGELLVDGYSGYNKVEGASLANCWVHARRYFIEASVSAGLSVTDPVCERALRFFDRIFDIEDRIREEQMTNEEKLLLRGSDTLPVVNELFMWADSLNLQTINSYKLRQAVTYLRNHESGLRKFILDPQLPADNNACERDFVPVARGRNNWLFAYSEAGARALGVLFSMVTTARRCKLKVMSYLQYVMDSLSKYQDEIPHDSIESVLPWDESVQLKFRIQEL